jgi:hypothetical protein
LEGGGDTVTGEEDYDIAAWLGRGDWVYTVEYAGEPLSPVVEGMPMIPVCTFREFSVETTLHRISYVTGPVDPPYEQIDAVFEEAISLEAVSILDDEIHPGENLRLAVRWQTAVPVQDSFRVFIHLIDQGEKLWAQADSVPGGGLLPMTAWEPGQTVVDRTAIQLPADMPPRTYQVRAGIYHLDNGLRLRVTQGSPAPDYVLVGEIEVLP